MPRNIAKGRNSYPRGKLRGFFEPQQRAHCQLARHRARRGLALENFGFGSALWAAATPFGSKRFFILERIPHCQKREI
jgi:hypothetical protein